LRLRKPKKDRRQSKDNFHKTVRESHTSQTTIRIREAVRKTASVLRVINTILIVFFLSSAIFGVANHNLLKHHRRGIARDFAKMRNSTVVTMVHRQEFVPHYAMSGGTLIALAADRIVMDKDAILGPVDPQLIEQDRSLPAVSLVNIPKLKPWKDIDDTTVVMIDQAKNSLQQIKHMVKTLLKGKMPPQAIDRIVARLTSGQITHDYPIFPDEAKQLGLPVSTNMPESVYKLMALYPQPGGNSTSRAG